MWRRARCNQLSRSLCKSIDGSAPFGSRGATTAVTLTADRSARSIFRRTNKESGNNGKTSYISATNFTSCRGTTNAESSFSTSTSSSLSWNQSRRYWVRGTAGNNHLSSCYTSSLLQSFQLQQRRLIRQRPTNTTTTATPTQTHLRTNPKPFEQPIAETSTIAGSAATVPTTASVTTTTTTTISRVIPTFKRNVSVALGLGSLSGAATACAGLGASLILNPGLTGLLGLTQLEANATNMVALTVSALAGSGHFLSAGIVNIPVALCLSIPSIIFATVGAKYAHKFPPRALQLAFCLLLGAVVPMAVYRDYTLTKDPQKKNVSTHHNKDNAQSTPWPTTVEEWRNLLQSSMEGISTSELIKHSGMGVVMGLMSGIMGIGGAFLVAAYLSIGCQMSQQEVLGTAVFGILPPAVVSSAMHLRLGNVKTTLLPPLLVGTLAGAMGGAQLALFLPEDALRHIFTAVLAIIGCVSIQSFLRRKAK